MSLFTPKPKPVRPPHDPPKAKAIRPEPAITVSDIGSQMAPWLEESVIFHATGKLEEAITILSSQILKRPGNRDPLPWLMLFDIYEANGQREKFEDLALDYAVRFEHSPPSWAPVMSIAPATTTTAKKFVFGPQFGPIDKARLEHFLLEAGTASHVILDFSQTPTPTAVYAQSILSAIERLRREGKAIAVLGGPAFVVRLNMACTADRLDASGWLLLLAVKSLLSDAEGFEETALAYAIRYEISPPSFVEPEPLPEDRGADETGSRSENAFSLEGIIDTKAAEPLSRFVDFGAGKTHVELDISRVSRIDFASTGLLLDALIRLQAQGIRVLISHASLPNLALLKMIGADQFATLQPRRRQ